MTFRSLLALALISCLAPAPGGWAQGYNKKDLQKAEELAAKDKTFAELSPEEREEAVQKIAAKIHGIRRRANKADIVTLDGKTLEELEAKRKARYKRYELVSSEETKGTEQDPPRTELVTNSVGTAPFGRLFQDNEWDVVEGSEDAEALRKQVDAILEKAKATGGRIIGMHVESSASTLRNTGKAEAMTHAELSRARATEAAAFVKAHFLARAQEPLSDDQVTMDFSGSNGNGTSGPSSPYPCPAGVNKKFCPEGSGPAPSPDCVAPEDLADFYDQFKYVKVSFDILTEVASTDPGAVRETSEARMVLVAVGTKSRWKIRLPKFDPPRRVKKHKKFKGKVRTDRCPVFD